MWYDLLTCGSCDEHVSLNPNMRQHHHLGFLKVKFHAHLNSMEESMNATKKERIDVESLTRQLETGRTRATLELQARRTLSSTEG